MAYICFPAHTNTPCEFLCSGLHLFPRKYKYTLWIALQSTLQKRNNKVTIVLRLFSIYAFFVGCLFLTGMAFIVFPQLQHIFDLHILRLAFYRSGQHMFSCTISSTVSIYAFCWSLRDLVERRGAIQNMGHTTPHWLANCFFLSHSLLINIELQNCYIIY